MLDICNILDFVDFIAVDCSRIRKGRRGGLAFCWNSDVNVLKKEKDDCKRNKRKTQRGDQTLKRQKRMN